MNSEYNREFFVVQDEIQSFLWNNNSATIYPFVCYYGDNGELKSVYCIVISSCVQHGECSTSLPEKACQLPDPGVFVVANYQKRSICLMAIQELQKLPQPVP